MKWSIYLIFLILSCTQFNCQKCTANINCTSFCCVNMTGGTGSCSTTLSDCYSNSPYIISGLVGLGFIIVLSIYFYFVIKSAREKITKKKEISDEMISNKKQN